MESTSPAAESAVATQDLAQSKGNFGLAIAAGLVSAIAGAALWAVVTVLSQYEIGIMAIAVGFIVGRAIKFAGKGNDKSYGYLGAFCALLGCVLGNVLSAVGFFAQAKGLTYPQALGVLDLDLLQKLMSATFSAMDLLFYGIAIYEGYRFSFSPKSD